MITFESKKHIEIDAGYQGINLTEFAFVVDNHIDNDQIIDTFIRSTSFSYDSLRDCIKKEPKGGYLRCAFDIEKIKISDFKKCSKAETLQFLLDLSNDDFLIPEFPILLDKYQEIHQQLGDSDFYIISKEWFNEQEEKLIAPESWCYTYYFLIISLDRSSNLLTLMEWKYD